MTYARVQPFCREHNIKKGCFDGFRVYPGNILKRNQALYFHKNHFCLIWKSQGTYQQFSSQKLISRNSLATFRSYPF